MSFESWPVHPTQYFLEEVALYLCNFSLPVIRRGTTPHHAAFYQPGHMYNELVHLQHHWPVTLRVVEANRAGKRRETSFGGLVVRSVTWLHDGVDGCRVELSDLRELIDSEAWLYDINLVHNGRLVPETAQGRPTQGGKTTSGSDVLRPHTVHSFLRDLEFKRPPFDGALDGGWDEQLSKAEAGEPGGEMIPFQTHGQGRRSEMLQKLLEQWGYDLAMTVGGKFYIAGRHVPASGPDPGLAQLQQLDMEWVDYEPQLTQPGRDFLRAKRYRMPFWEVHTFQVWYNQPAPGQASAGDGGALHPGLILEQCYQSLDDYWDLNGLLRAHGLEADLERTSAEYRAFQRFFMRKYLRGTIAARDSALQSLSQQARASIVRAVQSCERRMFMMIPDLVGSRAGFGDWLDMKLGRQRPDGTVIPTRAVGTWTLVYNAANAHEAAIKGKRFPELAKVFDGAEVLEGGQVVDPPNPYIGEGGVTLDNIWDALDNPNSRIAHMMRLRRDFIIRLAYSCPMFPTFVNSQAQVIRLDPDERALNEVGQAVMGEFDQAPGYALDAYKSDGKKKQMMDELLQGLEQHLKAEGREDFDWNPDYNFFILVTGRRNFPQGEGRYWWEEREGFPDAPQDVITLLPDDRVQMRRNFVDRERRLPPWDPDKDGWGRPLNLQEVKAQADRKIAYIRTLASQPLPVNHRFLNVNACNWIRARGALDGVTLHVNGRRVECEVHTAARADDMQRRLEAELQRARAIAEFGGKIMKR